LLLGNDPWRRGRAVRHATRVGKLIGLSAGARIAWARAQLRSQHSTGMRSNRSAQRCSVRNASIGLGSLGGPRDETGGGAAALPLKTGSACLGFTAAVAPRPCMQPCSCRHCLTQNIYREGSSWAPPHALFARLCPSQQQLQPAAPPHAQPPPAPKPRQGPGAQRC
jgi:hypothetical protein